MALLSDLFGIPNAATPQRADELDMGDLLRRAVRLNQGVTTSEAVASAPSPLEMRDVREYPVARVAEPAPAAPAAPAVTPPAAPSYQPREITLGDRLRHAGLALQGRDTQALGRANETENLTVKMLMDRAGLPQEQATAVARNPTVMSQIIPQVFGPKDPYVKLAPEEALVHRQTGQIAARNDTAKASSNEKDYRAYVQDEMRNNRAPQSFHNWDLERRRAAATAVSINDKRENTFQSEAGKTQAKRFGELIEQGGNARTMLGQLQQLSEIAKNVQTGPQAVLTATLGPWAQALGLKIDGLSDIEAYKAITDRLSPQMRVPGSGATSDFDAKQFLSSLPNITRTSGGNEIVNKTLQLLAESQLRAGEIASRVYSGDLAPNEGERLIRDLPDPYADYKVWAKQRQSAPEGWRDPESGAIVRRKN